MKKLKLIAIVCVTTLVTACGQVSDIPSRSAPIDITFQHDGSSQMSLVEAPNTAPFSVSKINVNVPKTLSVSEADSLYPQADIIWEGDALGDRHAQVKAIFESAFYRGTSDMIGANELELDVEVLRFHGLDEMAGLAPEGMHNMAFSLTVRRASTGEPLAPARLVQVDLPALAGKNAMKADQKGQTSKVRITDQLTQAIRDELNHFVIG